MDIPHDLSGRVEATCKWLESGTSVFTTDMAHDIRARIAELEASLADESARVEEFRSTLAETRKQRDAILARAEQAEAILLGEDVTVAAYRNMQAALAQREAERDKVVSVLARALAAKLDQQNGAEQAEAELAEVQALRFDLQHKLDDARAALAERDRIIEAIADGRWNVGRSHSLQTAPDYAKWQLRLARAEEGIRDE